MEVDGVLLASVLACLVGLIFLRDHATQLALSFLHKASGGDEAPGAATDVPPTAAPVQEPDRGAGRGVGADDEFQGRGESVKMRSLVRLAPCAHVLQAPCARSRMRGPLSAMQASRAEGGPSGVQGRLRTTVLSNMDLLRTACRDQDTDKMNFALDELLTIFERLSTKGAEGRLLLTIYVNAVMADQGVELLHRLSKAPAQGRGADSPGGDEMAAKATKLFQHIVPMIWPG